jgi:glucan phosphoethanolaminetransferase (alkaline phosphatase superfamily)
MRPMTRVRILLLGAACAVPYATMLVFCLEHHYRIRSALALLGSAGLLCWLLAGGTRTWGRFFLAYLPLLLLSIGYVIYAFSFGMIPGRIAAILLISASWEEIRGLIALWPHRWILVPALGLLIAYVWLARGLRGQAIFVERPKIAAHVLLAFALLATVAAATDGTQLIDGFAANPAVGSLMFFADQVPRARAEVRGADIIKIPFHATRASHAEEVHLLIIGESARRGSWSLYGYPRETTPYLEGIRNELFALQRVFADANLTTLAVPMILTGIAPQDFLGNPPHGNLLDLAKEAGYSTTWLVNQDLNVSSSVGIAADHLDVPPELHEGVFGRHVLDETLLEPLHRALARHGARFIGLHIMESHWEYYLRYPPAFARYSHAQRLNPMSIVWGANPSIGAAIVDTYDNSTLHSDWFLGQVIDAVRALKAPATVTFIPDHGESLSGLGDGDGGHGGAKYVDAQFHIPAFVWVNAAYRAAHPEKVAALAANAGKEIHSHDFFYAIADLMGISWPAFAPERSFASARFVADTACPVLVGGVLQQRPETNAKTADVLR